MQNSLSKVLEQIRLKSQTEFEKGEYFEKLVKVFLENDTLQGQTYDKVWHFKDWAKEQGLPANDTGIDLVARHVDGSGFCAIQCKFYAAEGRINKKHIDSFVSAASTSDFTSLVIVDTTLADFSSNLTAMLDRLDRDWYRIALTDLEKSRIDWGTYFRDNTVVLKKPKTLRPHQKEALETVRDKLTTADRGTIVMACGTGKTFTSLKVAEELAGKGKLVLYLVPSLALMSQTVREWKNDSAEPFLAFSVCSDTKVGKRTSNNDEVQFTVHDLAFPATTDGARIAEQVANADSNQMIVVFSTYQSIQVLTNAQQTHDLPEFDWIICDEAHRTTGATLSGATESKFVRVHDNAHVAGKKRLYMTATPKIYGPNAKKKAKQNEVILADMNNPELYGEIIFHRSFGWAVENNLLTDYKVIVLAVDEGLVSAGFQTRLAESSEMKLDDATKLVGVYKALTKQNIIGEDKKNPKPMKRALAFCKNIAISKMITNEFSEIVEEYTNIHDPEGLKLSVQTQHVDGTFNAKQREDCLDWLKEETDAETCRILTNARCLSEGVDVPALDSIIFMHPRRSQIDVVQSVGRVMRKHDDKDMGYVILPVAVPAGIAPEDALNDNERYEVVWEILNALRAHDERFDGLVNQIGLGEDVSDKIQIFGVSQELAATTAVVDDIDLDKGRKTARADIGGGSGNDGQVGGDTLVSPEVQGAFIFDELTQAIRAKIVEKCGTREYWDKWAKDIAEIAKTHITRIKTIVKNDSKERKAFIAFLEEIRDDLNPEISEEDAIEMLAQHLITKPVFDTLFKDNEFTKNNPVSKAMETVLGQLDHHNLSKESESLTNFYASVQRRADGIKTAQGRQTLVVELYDKFFRTAFPAMTKKLGIVYTPVEVVDFIIHSVNDVLQTEFNQTLGSKGVHIIDPFTGTGTFITRLLQSGLIKPEELEHKYKNEIHANEIVLLAYYIAAINIEAVYHDMAKEQSGETSPYTPFEGICLTDTFQLHEQERDMIANLLPDNSNRRSVQKELDIRVIIGNPPYSSGQNNANENAANVAYTNLDDGIRSSYARYSSATNKNALYDSYIRSIRWATDRITRKGNDRGIVAYVSNGGWLDGNSSDGLRKCLAEEYSSIYVFHLRGNQRTSGELSRREGGKIFGSGSRAPIAITVLVRNPDAEKFGQIYFYDIGDYLNQKDKLAIIQSFKSISGISTSNSWSKITPDENHDWLNQADQSFYKHIIMGVKRDPSQQAIFSEYSNGIKTNSDAWMFNSSPIELEKRMLAMTTFYNHEVERYLKDGGGIEIGEFVSKDPTKISWHSSSLPKAKRGKLAVFDSNRIVKSIYRPFQSQNLYHDKHFVQRVALMPKFFPNVDTVNRIISVKGVGGGGEFNAFMTDRIYCLQPNHGTQCFPLKIFEPASDEDGLFASDENHYTERDGISDDGFQHFQTAYPTEKFSKEDLFYYIYGLLHCPDYCSRFNNNLSKELPRIPAVKTATDFWKFSKAGRLLGDLHVNFETIEPHQVVIKEGDLRLANIPDPTTYYRVEKMKFGGKGKNKDKTTVHYNSHITMTQIPLEAYDYVVNGKPALQWVMERQSVKTDKASGIVNDANDYANETMNNPAYPLELFQRVITVSLETMKIVKSLPNLDID